MEAKSREEAAKLGLPRYFTGKPCSKGHVSERYTMQGACVECVHNTNAARTSQIKKWMKEAKDKESS